MNARACTALQVGVLALLLAAGCGTAATVQAPPAAQAWRTTLVDEPWEPALAGSVARTPADPPAPSYQPVGDAMLWMVELYRERIGPRSIQRCPFHVSCSTFALRALEQHGALGLLLLVDRYFYREHGGLTRDYTRVVEPDGTLKVDDTVSGWPWDAAHAGP